MTGKIFTLLQRIADDYTSTTQIQLKLLTVISSIRTYTAHASKVQHTIQNSSTIEEEAIPRACVHAERSTIIVLTEPY